MDAFQMKVADEVELQPTKMLLESWSSIQNLTVGFSTRQAGNTALHIGDDEARVVENRHLFAQSLDWDFAAWTCAEQVHGVRAHTVELADKGKGRSDRLDAIRDADAILTDEPDILLAMYFADCVPLFFYDPVNGAMALAHAGWKGTVGNVVQTTVSRMKERYGTKPSELMAAIGPSIGSCCYEVDEAVLRHVRPLAADCVDKVLVPSSNYERANLDLKLLNRHLMIKAGILPSRIELSDWCTGCRTDLFFSHRMEQGKTGRMMSWIGKKSG